MWIFSFINDLPAIENWWLAEHLKNILKSCFIIIAIFNSYLLLSLLSVIVVLNACFHNFTFHHFADIRNTLMHNIDYHLNILVEYSNCFFLFKGVHLNLKTGWWRTSHSHFLFPPSLSASDWLNSLSITSWPLIGPCNFWPREIWEKRYFEKRQSWAHVTNHGTPWLPGEHGPQNLLPSSLFLPII